MTEVEGSCLCGKIRYQVEIFPNKIFNCHCQFCRKAHGADYVTVALANAATLNIDDSNKCLKEHQNDIGGFRAFCSECGTRLMNYAPDKSIYFSVCLSTVDTHLDVKPLAHVNTESRARWCQPYDGIAEFSGLPDKIV